MNIISIAKLHEEGCKILFDDHVTIMRENVPRCIGRKQQELFELFHEPVGPRVVMTIILELKQMITKAKRQIDNQVKLLKVEIEDEFTKDIYDLISPNLEVVSIPLVFSSISQTSRVGEAERYCNTPFIPSIYKPF